MSEYFGICAKCDEALEEKGGFWNYHCEECAFDTSVCDHCDTETSAGERRCSEHEEDEFEDED